MIVLREYVSSDCTSAAGIYNEVIREGISFVREEELTLPDADDFLRYSPIRALRMMTKTVKLWVSIYFIPTTSGDAVIYAMPDMR